MDNERLDFNTFFNIERDGDRVNYRLVINNPTCDMKKVRALLINDYVSEEVYPSTGIFDNPIDLLSGSDKSIILKGTIVSADDLSDVCFKLYLEYVNGDNEKEEIYYEVQRG